MFGVAVSAVVLSACGSSGTQSPESAGAPVALPAVEVIDVTADRRVQLDELLPSDRPLLIWFWAPH